MPARGVQRWTCHHPIGCPLTQPTPAAMWGGWTQATIPLGPVDTCTRCSAMAARMMIIGEPPSCSPMHWSLDQFIGQCNRYRPPIPTYPLASLLTHRDSLPASAGVQSTGQPAPLVLPCHAPHAARLGSPGRPARPVARPGPHTHLDHTRPRMGQRAPHAGSGQRGAGQHAGGQRARARRLPFSHVGVVKTLRAVCLGYGFCCSGVCPG